MPQAAQNDHFEKVDGARFKINTAFAKNIVDYEQDYVNNKVETVENTARRDTTTFEPSNGGSVNTSISAIPKKLST